MAESSESVLSSFAISSSETSNDMTEKVTERHTGAAEAPTEVAITRKRKSEKMDTEDNVKRPSFPPISADKLTVNTYRLLG